MFVSQVLLSDFVQMWKCQFFCSLCECNQVEDRHDDREQVSISDANTGVDDGDACDGGGFDVRDVAERNANLPQGPIPNPLNPKPLHPNPQAEFSKVIIL